MASWCDNLAAPPRVLIAPREHENPFLRVSAS
uniref:Uncharacterized protein n=1 Tax=Arundo donax TaxID=35708 RepID=A0A0A9ELS0_ARUDO